MTSKEYYNSTRMVETRNWTLDMVMNFAEEYHQSQLQQNKVEERELDNLNDEISKRMFKGKRKGFKL